jgi:ACDE family multidrug resistance protein
MIGVEIGENKGGRHRRPCYLDANLRIIFGITLTAVMGISIFVPAFPKMVSELNISPYSVGLLISAYTLPGIVLTPILGFLADRFGRKRIIFPTLVLFGLAGGACAFVRDFNLLLALRFLQGLGATSLIPLGVTIICDIYSGDERAEAVGYNAGFVNIGHASFPFIGGAIAMLGWEYPFLLYLVAIPVGLLVMHYLKNPEPKNEQGLKEYMGRAWQGVKDRSVLGIFMASTITFVVIYGGYQTYLPILVGSSFGASSLVIGLVISCMFLIAAATSSQLGKLTRGFEIKKLLAASFILYGFGLFIIPFISNIWLLLIPTLILGIAHGVNIPVRHSLLARFAPVENRAAFLSINEVFLLLGLTSGPLLMGLIFSAWGMSSVFYAGAGLSVAMSAVAVLMVR